MAKCFQFRLNMAFAMPCPLHAIHSHTLRIETAAFKTLDGRHTAKETERKKIAILFHCQLDIVRMRVFNMSFLCYCDR